jgi:uncharacterized membrane protein
MSVNSSWWRGERRTFWIAVLALCAIAVAISIRRLSVLADPPSTAASDAAALDALFAAKSELTGSHVLSGLVLAVLIPIQLSARVRQRYPRVHRWLGRVLLLVGILVGVTAYGMMVAPVGGWLETSATGIYGTAFLGALVTAWWQIRRGDVTRHREWMLRAIGIVLGIATTRPVMAIFFATSAITSLRPFQFFGVAMWIGFTSTVLAAEWYIRSTRRAASRRATSARGNRRAAAVWRRGRPR